MKPYSEPEFLLIRVSPTDNLTCSVGNNAMVEPDDFWDDIEDL